MKVVITSETSCNIIKTLSSRFIYCNLYLISNTSNDTSIHLLPLILAEFSLQIKYFCLIQVASMVNMGPLHFWVTGHFLYIYIQWSLKAGVIFQQVLENHMPAIQMIANINSCVWNDSMLSFLKNKQTKTFLLRRQLTGNISKWYICA